MSSLHLLILAGGAGTRLWPASTERIPKPFLRLRGRTLLRRTADRLSRAGDGGLWVSTNQRYRDQTEAELPEAQGRVIGEPARRNTAPAIAWALAAMSWAGAREADVVVIAPADQHVDDEAAFEAALRAAIGAARVTGQVVTLGIRPDRPETGFGYIEAGAVQEDGRRDLPGIGFVEKPDAERAREMCASGRFLWNAGIFVAKIETLVSAYQSHAAGVWEGAKESIGRMRGGDWEGAVRRFEDLPDISVDYAVIERLAEFRVVPVDCGWADVGSWEAFGGYLSSVGENLVEGTLRSHQASGNIVYSSGRPVVLIGVDDLVVVEGPEGVLVARRGQSAEVRKLRN